MPEFISPLEAIAAVEACLADAMLSDAERRELTATLREARPLEETLRRVRNRAFEIAREHLVQGYVGLQVITWLDGLMRAIDGARPTTASAPGVAHFSPGEDCLRAICLQLRSARHSIDICVFTISDDRISSEIVAAHRRRVALRIITDNEKELDPGSDIAQFRREGIAVRVDRSSAHMHHKFALFDGQLLLNGSYNWTRSAAESNEENLIQTRDLALVKGFAAQFEQLWVMTSD